MVSWSAVLQSFCHIFVAQEEKCQQRYLNSFKVALQIEEFHYWNWELMLSIFCRNCGSLLRPFLWVWRVCFQVWICKNCCAGQGCGWWLVPILNSCLREMKEQDGHIWLFSNFFPSFSPVRSLGNSCSFYVSNCPERISVQRQLFIFKKTHKFLVPVVTLSMTSMPQLFTVWWTVSFCCF